MHMLTEVSIHVIYLCPNNFSSFGKGKVRNVYYHFVLWKVQKEVLSDINCSMDQNP